MAAGFLHDAVERGTLSEEELRGELDESMSSLIVALSEDPKIDYFGERKLPSASR